MTNKYYTHFPVESPHEASILSDEYTWTILDILRKAGPKGYTAAEVHQKVEREFGTTVSRSKIYGLLKQLYQDGAVHRYYDQDAQAQRNAIGVVWGGSYIDEQFDNAIVDKEKSYIKRNLSQAFFSYIKKVMNDLNEDPAIKKWLPRAGPKSLCPRCRESHEADEFFSSVLDIAVGEFLDSDEFTEFLKQNDFAESEEEE